MHSCIREWINFSFCSNKKINVSRPEKKNVTQIVSQPDVIRMFYEVCVCMCSTYPILGQIRVVVQRNKRQQNIFFFFLRLFCLSVYSLFLFLFVVFGANTIYFFRWIFLWQMHGIEFVFISFQIRNLIHFLFFCVSFCSDRTSIVHSRMNVNQIALITHFSVLSFVDFLLFRFLISPFCRMRRMLRHWFRSCVINFIIFISNSNINNRTNCEGTRRE